MAVDAGVVVAIICVVVVVVVAVAAAVAVIVLIPVNGSRNGPETFLLIIYYNDRNVET